MNNKINVLTLDLRWQDLEGQQDVSRPFQVLSRHALDWTFQEPKLKFKPKKQLKLKLLSKTENVKLLINYKYMAIQYTTIIAMGKLGLSW